MNNTLTQGFTPLNPQENLNRPLKVILMESTGAMMSLWLPEEVEGRYFFTDQNETERKVPLYIMASEGRWIAVCGSEGYFEVDGMTIGSRVIISDQFLMKAVFPNAQYIFYAEEENPEDHIFIPCYIESHTDILIGRNPANDICYPNKRVSGSHAAIHWTERGWRIVDKGSRNGVYLNGRLIKDAEFNTGDVVYIMGLYIIMGVGFIALNNKTGRIVLNGPKIRLIQTANDVVYSGLPAKTDEVEFYERQPRRSYQIKPDAIEIESPPMAIPANKVPFLLRMSNPAISGGQALLSGNIVSAVSSMVLPFLTQGLTEKDRKDYDTKRTTFYTSYLENKFSEIKKEVEQETRTLNRVYPSLSDALRFPTDKTRLWERRKFDTDFLSVRIGNGTIPMIAEKEYQKKLLVLTVEMLQARLRNGTKVP